MPFRGQGGGLELLDAWPLVEALLDNVALPELAALPEVEALALAFDFTLALAFTSPLPFVDANLAKISCVYSSILPAAAGRPEDVASSAASANAAAGGAGEGATGNTGAATFCTAAAEAKVGDEAACSNRKPEEYAIMSVSSYGR